MVKSIKSGRHVESRKNCDLPRVNIFHDIIRELEQGGLSGMKLTVG